MCRFNADSTGLLVASDVAARGLDFVNVHHVIHYQVPMNTEVRGLMCIITESERVCQVEHFPILYHRLVCGYMMGGTLHFIVVVCFLLLFLLCFV